MITRIHPTKMASALRRIADQFDQQQIRGVFIVAIADDMSETGWGIDCEKMSPHGLIGAVQVEVHRMIADEISEEDDPTRH